MLVSAAAAESLTGTGLMSEDAGQVLLKGIAANRSVSSVDPRRDRAEDDRGGLTRCSRWSAIQSQPTCQYADPRSRLRPTPAPVPDLRSASKRPVGPGQTTASHAATLTGFCGRGRLD